MPNRMFALSGSEIVINLASLNDNAIGLMPVTLPSPAFFCARGVLL
jgi:hypothetical protein